MTEDQIEEILKQIVFLHDPAKKWIVQLIDALRKEREENESLRKWAERVQEYWCAKMTENHPQKLRTIELIMYDACPVGRCEGDPRGRQKGV